MRKIVVKVFKHGLKEPIRVQEFQVDNYLDWCEFWQIPGAENLVIRVEVGESKGGSDAIGSKHEQG